MTHKPATAYQYRRAIALVQVLAIRGSDERLTALEILVGEWADVRPVPPPIDYDYLDETIHRLAAAALQHAREEEVEGRDK